MKLRAFIILFLALALFFSCGDLPGDNPGDNTGDNNDSPIVDNSDVNSTIAALGVRGNLVGATALVTTGGASAVQASFSRSLEGDEALIKIMEDGSVDSVLNLPEGVTLPPVDFTAVGPAGEVYVCFEGAATIADGVTLHFFRILADGTIEVIETEAGVLSFEWDWDLDQDPVTFTADGAVYYAYVDGDGGTSLRKYLEGTVSTITPDINLSIERFFSDGTNVFLQGRNGTADNSAFYLKVVRPGAVPENIVYSATGDCWLRDIYVKDGYLLISGYNIPDMNVEARYYNGVLKLVDGTDGFEWQQVFGSAGSSEGVYRRKLHESRLTASLEAFNTDYADAEAVPVVAPLELDAFIDLIVAQFFVDGVVPVDLDPMETIDVSAATDKGTHELTYWYALLSDETGFDADFFDQMTVGGDVFPWIDGGTNPTAMGVFLYDILFEPERDTGYFPISVDTADLLVTLKGSTAVTAYFDSLELTDAANIPVRLPYVSGDGTMEPLLAFLDEYFTYTTADGVDFTELRSTWKSNVFEPYPDMASDLYNLQGVLKTAAYNSTYTTSLYPYRAAFLADDGSVDEAAVTGLLGKFYESVTIVDTTAGADISSNTETSKAALISSYFDLDGDDDGSDDLLLDPDYFIQTQFMDETNPSIGYSADPYAEQNLSLDTLFDSFDTMRYYFTDDATGEIFAMFENGDDTLRFSLILDADDNPVNTTLVDDLPAVTVKLADGTLYYTTVNGAGVYGLYSLALSTTAQTPTELIAPAENYEIFTFEPAPEIFRVNITAQDLTAAVTFTGFVDTMTGILTIPEEEIPVDEDSDLEAVDPEAYPDQESV